jgi:ketosteroid isomerase-like protein
VKSAAAPFVALLAIAGASPVVGQHQHEADVKLLHELQKRVDAAIVTGDIDTYATLLTRDAVLMPPNGPAVVGRDAILAWSRAFAKAFSFEAYHPMDAEVAVAGDWAFKRAAFCVTLVPNGGGEKVVDTGKFIIIYKREADGWKVSRDIWNSDGPPNNELQRTRPAQAMEPRR